MDGYLVWLIFIVFVVIVSTIFQLKESRHQRLKKDYRRLKTAYDAMLEERKKIEFNRGEMETSPANPGRLKEQLQDIKNELRSVKRDSHYLSAKRLEHLEEYVDTCIRAGDPDLVFLGTFEPLAVYTFREQLIRMLDKAEFEIEIISPWIKRYMWDCIKVQIASFVRRGGALKVFIRDDDSDFSRRVGDDIRWEVEKMGGEIIMIKQLHAKLYLVDRKEAIITSSNLTRGGIEVNFEAGIWSNNPVLLRQICQFVDNMYLEAKG